MRYGKGKEIKALKRSAGGIWFDSINYLFMLFIVVITLYPFANQVSISLSTTAGAYSDKILLIPNPISLDTYKVAFHYDAIWSGFNNSLFRMGLGTLISVVFTALTAYPLVKKRLPFRKTFIMMILFTMLFNGGLIPNFFLVKELGFLDTIWALVIPGMISGFNVYIMAAFFRNLPESLEESAKIDGAGYFRIFTRIVFPLSLPVIAVIALWVAVGHWNEWFASLIYTQDPHKYVLQVVLRRIIIENNTQDITTIARQIGKTQAFTTRQMQATVIMISTVPMLIIYPFVQKYFAKGVMLGAVKG